MPTARSVLCPVDFSEPSRQALRWAATIAQRRGGELTVLTVVEPLLARAAEVRLHVDLAHADFDPALREFVEETLPPRVRYASRLRLEAVVGAPSEAILRAARRLRPGLIVMGTHGRGGFRKLVLGSTTEHVVRQTEWPVLAVPSGAAPEPAAGRPAIQLGSILVATDFGEGATTATAWAASLAADISVPVVLAHVVEPVVVSPAWQALVADAEGDRVTSGFRALGALSAGFRNSPTTCVVSVGPPADTIASLAREHGAGLVVMGLANGEQSDVRTPGSIAYRVLRLSQVAVVVVPRGAVRAEPDALERPTGAASIQSIQAR